MAETCGRILAPSEIRTWFPYLADAPHTRLFCHIEGDHTLHEAVYDTGKETRVVKWGYEVLEPEYAGVTE